MKSLFPAIRRWQVAAILTAVLLLLAGAALAEGPHTVMLKCGGNGFVGTDKKGNQKTIVLEPEKSVTDLEEEETYTLDELAELPGFELQGAALRFDAASATGDELRYTLVSGKTFADPQKVMTGRNLWDVTDTVSAWLADRKAGLNGLPAGQGAVQHTVRSGPVHAGGRKHLCGTL